MKPKKKTTKKGKLPPHPAGAKKRNAAGQPRPNLPFKKFPVRSAILRGEAKACMDYLHGDVVDQAHHAACDYEYARESNVIRAAAAWHKAGIEPHEISRQLLIQFACSHVPMQIPWFLIWTCRSFPDRPWNLLSDQERNRILRGYPENPGKVKPMRLTDVVDLDSLGVLDGLKELATRVSESRKKDVTEKAAGQLVDPVVHGDKVSYILVTINHRKALGPTVSEFAALLKLPEFADRCCPDEHRGETGKFKDRLKDLAAFRLYESCSRDFSQAIEFSEKHRKKFVKQTAKYPQKGPKIVFKPGDARPFHDSRQGQTALTQINQADLYNDQAGFLKAEGGVMAHLKEFMPWDF